MSAELRGLRSEGRLTKADFQRVYIAAKHPDVCGDYAADVLEGFAMFAESPDWFDLPPS